MNCTGECFAGAFSAKNGCVLITQTLLDECLKSNRRAQNELYKECYNQLISVCWRYSGAREDAVELMNTGFVKILSQLGKYKSEIPFELWSRRVMINSIIDEYRKSKQYKTQIKLKEDYSEQIPEEAEENEYVEEMAELIKSKIHLLPPVTGKVFNLYAIDGYRHSEIAELLNMSEGTSMWHYSEAKRRIRMMIGEIQK
ncbi:MAG: sigma-70 family RNA polymerase sigma factor [Crocinitomicaceae bacterium]|nr:sigma-70 family RNA polymerase sigma factor [Crocinitomicaceae bacterium]